MTKKQTEERYVQDHCQLPNSSSAGNPFGQRSEQLGERSDGGLEDVITKARKDHLQLTALLSCRLDDVRRAKKELNSDFKNATSAYEVIDGGDVRSSVDFVSMICRHKDLNVKTATTALSLAKRCLEQDNNEYAQLLMESIARIANLFSDFLESYTEGKNKSFVQKNDVNASKRIQNVSEMKRMLLSCSGPVSKCISQNNGNEDLRRVATEINDAIRKLSAA